MTNRNHPHEVNPETVGQFTGVYDDDIDAIFEDDAVMRDGEKCLVTFIDGCFFCKNDNYMVELYTAKDTGDLNLIGNIHDNPKLMTQEDAQ